MGKTSKKSPPLFSRQLLPASGALPATLDSAHKIRCKLGAKKVKVVDVLHMDTGRPIVVVKGVEAMMALVAIAVLGRSAVSWGPDPARAERKTGRDADEGKDIPPPEADEPMAKRRKTAKEPKEPKPANKDEDHCD